MDLDLRNARHMIRLAVFLPFWLAACGTSVPRVAPQELLAEGKRFYEAGEYRKAHAYFKRLGERHPEADEAEEALFQRAEAERRLRRGQASHESYKKFDERYPNSRFSVKSAEGQYALGIQHFSGDIKGFLFLPPDRGFGVRVLDHMQVMHRNHSLADDALKDSAAWLIDDGRYETAVDTLRRLLSEYPQSEHALWARYELALSLWLLNQGAPYDERLLIRSRRQFADFIGRAQQLQKTEELADEIAEAERMLVRIDERSARKEYQIGRFYERTDAPRSAVYYYRHCIRSYPKTEAAEESRARLRELNAESEVSK